MPSRCNFISGAEEVMAVKVLLFCLEVGVIAVALVFFCALCTVGRYV